MTKLKVDNNVNIPMPVGIIGTKIEGKENFMAVGWVCRANYKPPMVAVSIGTQHYTIQGIEQNKCFSLFFGGQNSLIKNDYVGLVSGSNEDKSGVYDVFYGDLEHAPLIKDEGVSMECKLVQSIELPTNTLFIGEIVAAFCDELYIRDNHPKFVDFGAYFLTMPENNYYAFGQHIGKAWNYGKAYNPGK